MEYILKNRWYNFCTSMSLYCRNNVLRKRRISTRINDRNEVAAMDQTKRWRLSSDDTYNQQAISEAADMLQKGMTVAFPTETVYGLGADATNDTAVQRIFAAKGRPADNPLIAHVAAKEQLTRLIKSLPPYVDTLIDTFTPGPITFVLPHNGTCAPSTTAGLATIGVRIPDHPAARALLKTCDRP